MSSTSSNFAPALLRGLSVLGLADCSESVLALEFGLSAWMRLGGVVDFETARGQMLKVRDALLEAGEMDTRSEPIPLSGRSPRLDTLHLATYLGTLVERAASCADCEPQQIVERAIEQLAA
jgi:hypothetical protein